MKEFNTEAVCIPDLHYMVDISNKIQQIEKLIAHGDYFTINRARQYGKTTTISTLFRKLQDQYLMVRMSFEGMGSICFENDYNFVFNFQSIMYKGLKRAKASQEILEDWEKNINIPKHKDAFDYLSEKITTLCEMSDKEIVLMIDEVDKSSDNQIFLHFLGMLRNKYLDYKDDGEATVKSVILAGVYDNKNMKLKLRPDEEKKYNSPWNIAVDFEVDMSFSSKEISTMLQEYEDDHHTGMDIMAMSEEIYKYTNGYPYLVSAICKFIAKSPNSMWTKDSVIAATKHITNGKSPLIDSLIKNYENNLELQTLVDRIVLQGEQFPFTATNPVVDLGITLGFFFEDNGILQISNKIFEIVLYNHIIMKNLLKAVMDTPVKSQFIDNGKLNIVRV